MSERRFGPFLIARPAHKKKVLYVPHHCEAKDLFEVGDEDTTQKIYLAVSEFRTQDIKDLYTAQTVCDNQGRPLRARRHIKGSQGCPSQTWFYAKTATTIRVDRLGTKADLRIQTINLLTERGWAYIVYNAPVLYQDIVTARPDYLPTDFEEHRYRNAIQAALTMSWCENCSHTHYSQNLSFSP